MKYLLPFLLLLMGCASHSTRMDRVQVQQLSDKAAAIAHRQPEIAPPVYLIDNWADFKKISCGRYGNGCGLGWPLAFYAPYDHKIYVNLSMLDEPLDVVLIHELVHHLQTVQRDKRPCLDKEQEAYLVQQYYFQRPVSILPRAEASCVLSSALY